MNKVWIENKLSATISQKFFEIKKWIYGNYTHNLFRFRYLYQKFLKYLAVDKDTDIEALNLLINIFVLY